MNDLLTPIKTTILFPDHKIRMARCNEEVKDLVDKFFNPEYDEAGITGECFPVVFHADGTRTVGMGANIITDAGDEFYAARATIEQPANDRFTTGAAFAFDGELQLGTAGNAPSKTSDNDDITALTTNSLQAMDGTYPLTNDPDSDNPGTVGVDIVTYRVSYTTANANDSAIIQAHITNPSPSASEPVLCHSTISSFNKTSSDTLKFFWNHRMNGV